jgi:RNA polymerase sigma-70 factor (ECF subfamily)
MADWNQILDDYGRVVWRQALRMLGNEHDAADCFQAVMLEGFESSQRQKIRSWPGYLRRLTVVRSLDFLRTRYRDPTDPRPVDEIPIAADETPTPLEQQELAERLRRAITKLPEDQAEAFSLKWIDELSNEEVAQHMELSTNHVGVLLHRARVALRERMSAEDQAENRR